MSEPFYLSPGQTFEPGDIFSDLPFPQLRYPLEFFRIHSDKSASTIFSASQGLQPKEGDTARGPFRKRPAILLNWACDLDAVLRDEKERGAKLERRYWLAAPIRPIDELKPKTKARTIAGRQPNKFALPSASQDSMSPFEAAQFVDLRQITPINVPYFREASKYGSLSITAIRAMHAHLGMFFSGLVVFVQPIPCPNCKTDIDPRLFTADSGDDEQDLDY